MAETADEMPRLVEPMYAVPGEIGLIDEEFYFFEIKWDGIRAITYIKNGEVRSTGRKGVETTQRYPELGRLRDRLPGHDAIIDGEIVAFTEDGRPSFERIQERMHVTNPVERGLTRLIPVTYIPFDLLYFDGHLLFDLPARDRRALLDELDVGAPALLEGAPATLLEATRRQGLEGIIAKRRNSTYQPGRRSPSWLKLKHFNTQEVVVGGWKPGKGRREHGIGSLLMGIYEGDVLKFVGHVGTGFTDTVLDEMFRLLKPLETAECPFEDPAVIPRGSHWVRPEIVGEVAYTEWTDDGRLRAPTWRGIRDDKDPQEIRF